MSTEPSNALRFAGQPRWFDFYNCRVVLPEQQRFFYLLPFVLSGDEIPEARRGLYLYDGSNSSGAHRDAMERIATGRWSASSEGCDLRWGDGELFSATRIHVRGPRSRWDIHIRPFLSDHHGVEEAGRRFDLMEQLMLRRAPFIHRVPRMKGFATGWIEEGGKRWDLTDAPVYQAKNHGRAMPRRWMWLFANTFAEDSGLAFEIASLEQEDGPPEALARLSTPDGVELLTTGGGDSIALRWDGRQYHFSACSRDGRLALTGSATPDEHVVFTLPDPAGGGLDNAECFTGRLELDAAGRRRVATMAALGRAHRTSDVI